MKFFSNKLGFTNKELLILVFLLGSLIAGLVLKYSEWKRPAEFDYSNSDRNFEKHSKETFEELNRGSLSEIKKLRTEEIKKYADSLYSFADPEEKNDKKTESSLRININTAYAEDLSGLPGIGRVMAERIIEYREEHGGFRKIEELKKVKGIGEKKFEMIKGRIFIE
jgi:competence ComEA-like helix-hairpin-helix protein